MGRGTTLSTPSSLRLVLASTSHVPCTSILSHLCVTKSVPVPTVSSTTLSRSFPVRRMLPTTTPVVTTPSVRRSLTLFSTVFVSWLTTVPVSRVSSSSTRLVVVPDPVLVPSSSSVCPSTTAASPSSPSLCPLPHRSPPPSLSHTTPCSPPTPCSSTPTSPSALT